MNSIGKLAIFIQLVTLIVCDNYKTVDLCLEKKPKNIRTYWKPNHHKMRDLMTQAAIVNEAQNKTGGRYDSNSPSVSERSHVGTKTPVLGSTDFVTDTGKLDYSFRSGDTSLNFHVALLIKNWQLNYPHLITLLIIHSNIPLL